MTEQKPAGLSDVQAVYSGPEFELWELLMGEQVHIGGLASSRQLAQKAEIAAGSVGVDLCCCTGAGMRFLLLDREVASMVGVDATEAMVTLGRERCRQAGMDERTELVLADASHTGLADASADFVWGEDAWCYVVKKPELIEEAVRLVKTGGTVAFTDWLASPEHLTEEEAQRLMAFMKFPNLQSLEGYSKLLTDNGCDVTVCEQTGNFAPHVGLYLQLLRSQLRYDALKIVGFNEAMLDAVIGEMEFMLELAHAGKFMQGRFVARRAAKP